MTIKAPPSECKYIIIQAYIFKNQKNNTHFICVDINATVTFIDAELVLKDLIIQKTHFITVKEVSDQKVVSHYVDLSLYILESDETTVIIHIKAYVITDIQISVLLNINKLDKKKNNIAL